MKQIEQEPYRGYQLCANLMRLQTEGVELIKNSTFKIINVGEKIKPGADGKPLTKLNTNELTVQSYENVPGAAFGVNESRGIRTERDLIKLSPSVLSDMNSIRLQQNTHTFGTIVHGDLGTKSVRLVTADGNTKLNRFNDIGTRSQGMLSIQSSNESDDDESVESDSWSSAMQNGIMSFNDNESDFDF